ncbi:DUF998 domain-containing protein [Asanoa iriomotensis]|uniref:DUF998 domain-containing protein n=1 Tax=Asanoa iriomotensis TaxID=234613 RepID=A0ABQ4CDH0_9ACTN|nr:DUF998 domain-containing protein [Asanoa iriomotensis]GIF60812.1 hypothetical protein Air01nite_69070 [Asanoa iriomotensis]
MTATLSAPAVRRSTLLAAGAVGGPLFVIGVLAQAYTRDGFDLARHPLSSLALGDLGWLQVTNFIVYGLLTLAGAEGVRRTLPTARWAPRLMAVSGVALIVAAIFTADPINGYPPGTADAATWHGTIHSLAPAVAGIAGLITYILFARRFATSHEPGWLVWTVAASVAVLATNAASAATGDFRWLVVGQAIGAAWTTSLFLKMR